MIPAAFAPEVCVRVWFLILTIALQPPAPVRVVVKAAGQPVSRLRCTVAARLGGVVDLISRRPTDTPLRELLVNGTTRGGTDAVLFTAQPHSRTFGSSLLVGAHGQRQSDVDDDGWADIAGYSRTVVRPRLFWNDEAGRSVFATSGFTWESEAYFTGRQQLDDNPFRQESTSYVLFGGLVERVVGRWRLFVNVENLADVRQTNWDPLVRPSRAADGRWTVDAWAPLDGRVLNGGVRVAF